MIKDEFNRKEIKYQKQAELDFLKTKKKGPLIMWLYFLKINIWIHDILLTSLIFNLIISKDFSLKQFYISCISSCLGQNDAQL